MDPIQAANILMGVWNMLHDAANSGPQKDPETMAAETVEQRSAREGFDRHWSAMQERTDRLVLVVHAMWSLIAEKMGITEEELLKRINDLDAADGTVDGRVLPPPVRCSCGAMVSRRIGHCMFCGKPYQGVNPFEKV